MTATATVSAECRGCRQAIKRAGLVGGWTECQLCHQEWTAPKADKPAKQLAPEESLKRAITTTGSDMALLARWATRIYGRASSIEPTIRGDSDDKQEDERGNEFHRAMRVHRQFEAFRSMYPKHAEVVWFVYMQRTGGTATGLGDLYGEIAVKWAPKDMQAVWKRKRRSVRSGALQNFGRTLHDQAVVAYVACREPRT